MPTPQETEAAKALHYLANVLDDIGRTTDDGTLDELLDLRPRLWIKAWVALRAINFQPPEDMRRIEQHRAGAAWLRSIAKELESGD